MESIQLGSKLFSDTAWISCLTESLVTWGSVPSKLDLQINNTGISFQKHSISKTFWLCYMMSFSSILVCLQLVKLLRLFTLCSNIIIQRLICYPHWSHVVENVQSLMTWRSYHHCANSLLTESSKLEKVEQANLRLSCCLLIVVGVVWRWMTRLSPRLSLCMDSP